MSFENSADAPTKQLWLFNITNDPDEKNDLSGNGSYSDILNGMLADLKAYFDDSREPSIWPDKVKRCSPETSKSK